MTAVDFAAFVEELANVAARTLLPFFRTSLRAEDKSSGAGMFDPVTEADRAAESAMRHLINRTFANHGIIGEEFGNDRPDAEYVWVLDPIDGTKSFICGIPTWGTLIGLLHNGVPIYGMMVQPFTREYFTGDCKMARWRGHGADQALQERKLKTRSCADLREATVMTTSPLLYPPGPLEALRRVESATRLSRYGYDCYAFAMLAAGHVDIVMEAGVQPYDVAPLIPIIEGAGGIVTDWSGASGARGGNVIAAGDRRIHAKVLELLNA
ncbi:MAG: histidinol-phosphatase [Methylovirgula sp.]